MGVKRGIFYIVLCDSPDCKKMAEDFGGDWMYYPADAEEEAESVGFVQVDGKWACPDCQEESDD